MLSLTKSGLRQVASLTTVVALAIVGVLVSAALAASTSKTKPSVRRSHLHVFSHHLVRRARTASADSLTAPSGAVLAAVTDGTEVYAQEKTSELCVIHLTASEGGGEVCRAASLVESEGMVSVGGGGIASDGSLVSLHITALVPNGVKSVHFADTNGETYDLPVTNNVVTHEDTDVTSVSYSLPDGGTHVTNVAKMINSLPRKAELAGSSQ